MKQYGLGPNGGIVTALNLFSTKFGQVVDLIEKAGKKHKYCIIDTPGMWLICFFEYYRDKGQSNIFIWCRLCWINVMIFCIVTHICP